jgi:uronate dehydrogenase
MSTVRRLLITGAGGDVGRRITPLLKSAYDVTLSDMKAFDDPHGLPFIAADVRDRAAVDRAVAGMDGIIHLGGQPVEADWDQIRNVNIDGCYNVFEAARVASVKRIVFASSNHAVGYYPRTDKIPHDVTVLPDSRYGVSKAFGEALGAMYALKHGMKVTSLRIGNVNEKPLDIRRLAIMVHPEDLVQLIRIGLDHPGIVNEVFYGASGNARAWWDNSRAEAFGYRPKHNAEEFAAEAAAIDAKQPYDAISAFYQGGTFCAAEHTADFEALKTWSDRDSV